MSSRRESDFARLEQLLMEERRIRQEAEERAEPERQRAEDERRNRKEADEMAELEQQHPDDERRRAEESFVGTEKYGLCRLQLPWDNLSGLEGWQCTFRAGMLQPNPSVSTTGATQFLCGKSEIALNPKPTGLLEHSC